MPDADIHTIYGDGKRSVIVTPDEVIVRELLTHDGIGDQVSHSYNMISFSRAAFREINLGWERLQIQEEDDE